MIATIETAIVETIRAARLPYLRYLGTYGGELDGEPQSIVRQTPAVWVSYRDESAPDPRNTGRTRWPPPAVSKTRRPPATATPCRWAATR